MARILDSIGNPIWSDSPDCSWFAPFNIRHTAADAAGSFVLALTNPQASIKYLYIKHIRGCMVFDGTAAAAANQVYELVRYSIPAGVTPNPTTGTTLPITLKDSRMTASILAAANGQFKSGVLTLAGLTLIESLHFFRLPASVTNGIQPIDLDPEYSRVLDPIVIGPNQGLGIRLTVAAIIGLGLSGSIEGDERAF